MNYEEEKIYYDNKKEEKQKYLDDLYTIITNNIQSSELEGNCFYGHNSLNLYNDLYTKQVNLFWCGKQAVHRICEIGFNAGHSTMLMLLGRDKTSLDYTIFDIGQHKYTIPTIEYIKSKFNHIKFEYIEGDSTTTIPKWIDENKHLLGLYDVVHVDGGHTEHCIKHDMINSDSLVKVGGIIIIDDTNHSHINKYIDLFISSGNYIELDILPSYGYPHRAIKKIKCYN